MRIKIGIFITYLLLACILLEDALPYFADSIQIEFCESKTENAEKCKEMNDEWKGMREKFHPLDIQPFSFLASPGSIIVDSDQIPDSATQAIFSPPPELV